ncbi:2-alkenal reductase (NADP(+)-dependent) [Bienertia sinuspersici]
MGETISYKFVAVKDDVEGAPKEADFELIDASVSISSIEQSSNQVLVKCLQVSIDPYQLNRMKKFSPSQNPDFWADKLVSRKVSSITPGLRGNNL